MVLEVVRMWDSSTFTTWASPWALTMWSYVHFFFFSQIPISSGKTFISCRVGTASYTFCVLFSTKSSLTIARLNKHDDSLVKLLISYSMEYMFLILSFIYFYLSRNGIYLIIDMGSQCGCNDFFCQ